MSLPPVLEPLRCRHADCTFPEHPEPRRCARAAEFANPLTECRELVRQESLTPIQPKKRVEDSAPAPQGDSAAPWRGRHLDMREADELLQRSPARLIAVLGPYNAGKTCLLASFFLQIANGQHSEFPYRFASSRTLYGFDELVRRASTWKGKEGEDIVLHTPKEQGEQPGQFLHLGFRLRNEADNRHIDVVFSDVAGEWISEWATRADEESRSKLAFLQRTDGFIIVVDAEALLGGSGRTVDHASSQLIRRVLGEMRKDGRSRGFSLVLSKFDRVVDRVKPPAPEARGQKAAWGTLGARMNKIWTALEQARTQGFAVEIFPVSAFPKPLSEGQPAGVLAPFSHVLHRADRRIPGPRQETPIPARARMFQTMRRWKDAEP